MNCLKCGKETKETQVFCPHCLEGMKAYPVKSDTHVHLPTRTPKPAVRRRRFKRRSISTEEQLQNSKKTIRTLLSLILLLSLIVAFLGATLAHALRNQETSNLGKNYTYEETDG